MPELHDIVYILKPSTDPFELTYSLRSVEANFPHRLVWFICGQPKGLTPDRRLIHTQTGCNKWDCIKSSMWRALDCDEITEDFYLFNDDFFIMRPVEGEFVNFTDGTLADRIAQLNNPRSMYGVTLYKAEQELKIIGKPTLNYDVHLPMLFNKTKAREALKSCSSPQMRSVYGNFTESPHIDRKDVKVYDLKAVPRSPDYLSTNDDMFKNGKVGEYIRRRFTKPSRFEV